ncbi:asparagine synthase-related protein [Sphingomonas nostoxanthinifaciens]|uniref:asparagine synthase-related protein n=1 Tax=Sphingomonas nostoxanthinifaciens TaxID=2872652 RepID=UPI001CC1DF75|nr:asparagine synthase C-terminal domain-containing protein [Sphingomonas nostoxanthinifaciens]UAK25469.1 asparagine synthase C-terminal domain-containing protein [Sphingomonas nostoxanthinifaciens]
MNDFVALHWPPGNDAAAQTARRVRAHLLAQHWIAHVDRAGWTILASAHPVDFVRPAPGDVDCVIVGDLFSRTATERGGSGPGDITAVPSDFRSMCDHLIRRRWGAYVAMARDPDDRDQLLCFRDPVGMLDCVTWTRGALRIVTSRPEPLLAIAPPVLLSIDWTRVAALVRFPGGAAEALPIDGITTLPPGALVRITRHAVEARPLWTPATFARSVTSPERAVQNLPTLIDACIAAWNDTATVTIAELSGGLDSSIIASGLSRAARPHVAAWLHYHADDREADERRFARAVAGHLNLSLTEIRQPPRLMDEAAVDAIPFGVRPNLANVSLYHDTDLHARADTLGADLLLTGQGGDALFFQPGLPLLAADLWRDRRPWRQTIACLSDIARWTDRPIWSIGATMLRSRRRRSDFNVPDLGGALLSPALPRDVPALLWLDGTDDLTPAKRLQILNLAAARASFAGWARSPRMRIVHPLLSQPLLEHILPLSALALTEGKRDRALIRAAYAGRLPATLLERRGKGSVTSYYGRMLAASADFLRSYFHDGLLSRNHLLDRDALDAVLDPYVLMQHNRYTEILVLVLMERWARGFEALRSTAATDAPLPAPPFA